MDDCVGAATAGYPAFKKFVDSASGGPREKSESSDRVSLKAYSCCGDAVACMSGK
jgi:hypothetical protein